MASLVVEASEIADSFGETSGGTLYTLSSNVTLTRCYILIVPWHPLIVPWHPLIVPCYPLIVPWYPFFMPC